MASRIPDETAADSVADLLGSPRLIDPVERAEALDEVSRALFSRTGAPQRIGRYRLEERLGRGGQGVVYSAHDPTLDRRVAIKILRVHGDGSIASARLRHEAEMLARLAHPNVIAINDVGVCEAGVFIVMQYVPGRTLSTWLDEPRSWREIVEVFVAAGRGLAAAHDHGVVHRDFKPSNVWIGDDGIVRLLDFGLAEIEQEQPTRSSSTSQETSPPARHVDGTPAYMAPEQRAGVAATDASDQFAFCVTLFEALFGFRPRAGPSPRSLALAQKEASRASPGAETPTRLWRVVARGLRAAPSDRWPTMPMLIEALERCARPGRHARRVVLATAGTICLTAVAAWGGLQIDRARAVAACTAEAEAIDAAWNPARAGEIEAALEGTGVSYAADTWSRSRERIDDFSAAWKDARTATCDAADPDEGESLASASKSCLDERRERLQAVLAEFADPDETVVRRVGTATASMTQLRECTDEAALRRRMASRTDLDVPDRARFLRARLTEAGAASLTGRDARALELAESVLEQARREGYPHLVAQAGKIAGATKSKLGRYEEAAQALERAYFDALATADDRLALNTASWLVWTVGYHLARHDDGLKWQREALALADRAGLADDPELAGLLANTASLYFGAGDYERAQPLAERALAIKLEALGPEHPEVADALTTVAAIRLRQGDHTQAAELGERALEIQETTLGPMHPSIAMPLGILAEVHLVRSEYPAALAMFERALLVVRTAFGEEHPGVAALLNNCAVLHQKLDAPHDARRLAEQALAIQDRTLDSHHPDIGATLQNLANAHLMMGDHDRAQETYARALAIQERTLGPLHPEIARTLDNLGIAYRSRGEPEQARLVHERALSIWESVHGADSHEAASTLNHLGDVHRELGALAESERLHRRALTIVEKTQGPGHVEAGRSFRSLGDVLAAKGEHLAALADYERALGIYEGLEGEARRRAEVCFAVARTLWETGGDRARALRLARQAMNVYERLPYDVGDEHDEVRAWLSRNGAISRRAHAGDRTAPARRGP